MLGAGLHGGEDKTVGLVQGVDLPYVLPHIFHPEAVEAGVRFFGERELGRHFPPWPGNDPEDQAAARTEAILDAYPHFLGFDLHDFNAKRGSYVFCSDRVLPETLGATILLGMSRVVMMPSYPLYVRYPKMVALDIARGQKSLLRPEYWQQVLEDMYTLGVNGLRRVYEAKKDTLNFFMKVQIPRVTPAGVLDPERYAFVRDHLEGLPISRRDAQAAFSPISLPEPAAQALGIAGREVRIECWGDQNGSPLLPGEETRRRYFGALFVRTPPPVFDPETGGLVFSAEREPLIVRQAE